MFHEGYCIRLCNDAINEHLETGQTFARVGVLSKQNDRNIWHYLFKFSSCLHAIQYRHSPIEDYQIGTMMQRKLNGFDAVLGFSADIVMLFGFK